MRASNPMAKRWVTRVAALLAIGSVLAGCDSLLDRQVPLGVLPLAATAPTSDSGGAPANSVTPAPGGAPANSGAPDPGGAPANSVTPDPDADALRRAASALFDFRSASGPPFRDQQSDLSLLVPGNADPDLLVATSNGLEIKPGGILVSDAAPTQVIERSRLSNELSVEVWVTPLPVTDVHTRLVTVSQNTTSRNFTLGMGGNEPDSSGSDACGELSEATRGVGSGFAGYFFRRRWGDEACARCANNGFPELWTPMVAASQLTQVVATRDASGTDRIFVNAKVEAECSQGGDFLTWDPDFLLQVGDELVGGSRRFQGTISLVAIYDRALSVEEVNTLFQSDWR